MTAVPEVSVVMSVFNGGDTLTESVESVLQQESCEFELIVVDDGSNDGSAATLDRYAALDPRVRVIHQANTGLTRALIRGCAEARGAFIARQDSGDVSLPARLATQLGALRVCPDLAFVSCVTRYVGPQDEYLFDKGGASEADSPTSIIDIGEHHVVRTGPSHHGSVMFRRDLFLAVGGYREEFYFAQDWDLWYRLATVGKFQMLPLTLYQARIGVRDISTTSKKLQEETARLSMITLRLRVNGESDEEVVARVNRIRPISERSTGRRMDSLGCYFIGECLRRNGNVDAARGYLWRAIVGNPTNLKAWVRWMQCAVARRTGSSS